VLKLSGYGEATLWPELADVVRAWASHFPAVQLISNGTGSSTLLQQLSEVPNFQASITLDGHTTELDRFRTKGNTRLHRRVVDTIAWLVAHGTKVELNCVVSQANAGALDTYVEWVRDRWGPSVRLIPLPVRPTMGRTMADIAVDLLPSPSDIDRVEQCLVDRYAEFASVLPPLAYLSALVRFMRVAHRGSRCHIHRANFGVNTGLLALACACAGDRLLAPLGPVSSIGSDAAIEQRRRGYLADGAVGAKCATCFTHYDIINLYFGGLISEADLRIVPSLSHPGTLAHLNAIKQEIAPYLMVRSNDPPPAADAFHARL